MTFTLSRPAARPIQLNPPPELVSLQHNLPLPGVYLIQIIASVQKPQTTVVTQTNRLAFFKNEIDTSQSYKMIAYKLDRADAIGLADNVFWSDNYVYNAQQVNIEFKSQGNSGGVGAQKTFSNRVLLNGQPVARRVLALGIDGSAPVVLSDTASDASGQYTINWRGYSGAVLITALDDYGVPWVAGESRGIGERVHPSVPNGFVYECAGAGTFGNTEPVWPTTAGDSVSSGNVQLVAVPYYRPKTAGPLQL